MWTERHLMYLSSFFLLNIGVNVIISCSSYSSLRLFLFLFFFFFHLILFLFLFFNCINYLILYLLRCFMFDLIIIKIVTEMWCFIWFLSSKLTISNCLLKSLFVKHQWFDLYIVRRASILTQIKLLYTYLLRKYRIARGTITQFLITLTYQRIRFRLIFFVA